MKFHELKQKETTLMHRAAVLSRVAGFIKTNYLPDDSGEASGKLYVEGCSVSEVPEETLSDMYDTFIEEIQDINKEIDTLHNLEVQEGDE